MVDRDQPFWKPCKPSGLPPPVCLASTVLGLACGFGNRTKQWRRSIHPHVPILGQVTLATKKSNMGKPEGRNVSITVAEVKPGDAVSDFSLKYEFDPPAEKDVKHTANFAIRRRHAIFFMLAITLLGLASLALGLALPKHHQNRQAAPDDAVSNSMSTFLN